MLSLILSERGAASPSKQSSDSEKRTCDAPSAAARALDDDNQTEHRELSNIGQEKSKSRSQSMHTTWFNAVDWPNLRWEAINHSLGLIHNKATGYVGTTFRTLFVRATYKVLALHVWLTWLPLPVLAAGNPSSASGSTTISAKPRIPASKPVGLDVLKFAAGCIVCTALTVGAIYWRRMWKLLAPVMGASGVAFAILKDGDSAEAEGFSMM